jgi:hypothetical protein
MSCATPQESSLSSSILRVISGTPKESYILPIRNRNKSTPSESYILHQCGGRNQNYAH